MKILLRDVEAKLAEATNLQHAFWDALRDLEETLGGYELDANNDLGDVNAWTLLKQARKHAKTQQQRDK